MITAHFDYVCPNDVAGVVAALAGAAGEAVVLGGGTMLIPDMTHGLTRPLLVVDVGRAGLSYVREEGDALHVGAGTSYTEVLAGSAVAHQLPVLHSMASGITGGPQIRNRGTVGGSATYANPSSEVPAVLVALDAQLRLLSSVGARTVSAAEYITGPFRTVRLVDEVLVELIIPRPKPGTRAGYVKLKLSEGSWPIATAVAVADNDAPIRLALGGVAGRPVRVRVDPRPPGRDHGGWRQHVKEMVDGALVDPWTDVLADGDYRRQIAPVLAIRAIEQALSNSPGPSGAERP